MTRIVLVLAAALVLVPRPCFAQPREVDAGKKADEAIRRGLAFLVKTQMADGSWGENPAFTGLSVMAFLAAGHVPGEGPHGKVVEKGIRAVLKMQRGNGLFASDSGHEMYHHGICTLMTAEVVGMTQGPLADEVRQSLEKAVAIILKAQRKQLGNYRGGWRYNIAGIDSDMSVTGWQLMALRAAKNVGCDVPPDVIDLALDYVKRSRDEYGGGYRYTPGGGVTVPCTGTAVLCLAVCGRNVKDLPQAQKAGAFLMRYPPDDRRTRDEFAHSGHFFYSIYYCSQAMFQLGGNYWDFFRPRMHRALLQMQSPNGSWNGDGQGTAYGTAMAILALAVEYRFLPIYQRGEEPGDRK